MTLFLFYPSGRYETINQDYIYTVDDFIADVGGYVGLFLGVSINQISILGEIVYDAVRKIIRIAGRDL